MIEISDDLFTKIYEELKARIETDRKSAMVDFKTNHFVDENENYKYGVLEYAKNSLLSKTWKEDEIGKGRIIGLISKSIQPTAIYNNKKVPNNLLDWRKKDDFKKLTPSFENEKNVFDFFKSRVKDEDAFNRFIDIGFSYQLIAYLFFLKNSQKYMPISQERFDSIFKSMNLDFHTSHNISWDNYLTYNEVIKSFKNHLSKYHQNITLLDAHTFLWIYGYKFEKKKVKGSPNPSQKNNAIVKEKLTVHKEEEVAYQPKFPIDVENVPEDISEIDYIEQHKRLMEIGKKAEEYVLQKEIEYLIDIGYPLLAEKVRNVSLKPALGCDIISYETSGKQKQIEVKAISTNKSNKSFILTRNELIKSKGYNNYYVYCVTDVESDKPKIIRLKNPDFDNSENFRMEPLTYKVSFE